MEKKIVEIGQLDYDYLALAASEAAASIRCFPMTYGAKGVAFNAVMDTLVLLYGMTVGASYVEVFEVRDGTKAEKPIWRSIGNQEYEQVRSRTKKLRDHHEFILSDTSTKRHSTAYSIRVYPLDKPVERCFKEFPNIVSMLFGRRKVASITYEAIRVLEPPGPGRPATKLGKVPDERLYRELTFRVRFAIESQGKHKRLSDLRADGTTMPLLLVAQRTELPRKIKDFGNLNFSYRYILAPQQYDALSKRASTALESALTEDYKCRLDTVFESGSLTTHHRQKGDIGPRVLGTMDAGRLEGLTELRKVLKIDEGCFQLYVPLHVKGTVAFVIVFQLPVRQRLEAFSVYANFIPAFSANLRQSVFETALAHANTTKKFDEIVQQLCGERAIASDGRLVRSEGIDAYDIIIKERL